MQVHGSPQYLDSRSYFGAVHMSRMQADLAASRSGSNTPPESEMLRRTLLLGRKPHVCIVGAGFAGLRCADVLLQHGAQVTIFEGRNRLGGRLYQETVGGHLVDLGPNWIHGTKNNPILDVVRQTKTVTHSWGERQVTFDPDGHFIPEEEVAEASEILWGFIGEAFKYSHDHSADIPAERSLMDYLKERLDKTVSDSKRKALLLRLSHQWGPFIGGTTEGQSLKFLWLEETLEGENLFCAGTYQKVLELVSKPALDGAKIVFGKKVTKIRSKDNAEVSEVTVESSDGNTETFDEVVVTAPLGWLKWNKEAFEPRLPKNIQEAIDNLGYGNLDKVYISFPQAFWESSSTSNSVQDLTIESSMAIPNATAKTTPIHHPEPNGNLNGVTSNHSTSIQECLSQALTSYPGFTHFLDPRYAPQNPHHYTQGALNLAALPSSVAHPTLLFYTSGPNTQQISALVRAHTGDPAALKAALIAFFAPYVALLPHYAADDPRCVPSDVLATAWELDELTGFGSYTNIPAGIEDAEVDLLALRRGVPERGVWIAGEHCAPFVALGTVTGAWWSGELVAKRLVEAYGLAKVREDWCSAYSEEEPEMNG